MKDPNIECAGEHISFRVDDDIVSFDRITLALIAKLSLMDTPSSVVIALLADTSLSEEQKVRFINWVASEIRDVKAEKEAEASTKEKP